MAFDGSGTFNRPVSDYVYDTVISETSVNTEMDGIATGLSTCIAKDGQTTVTANLPMATYRHTGVGDASARTDYAAAGQVQDSSLIFCGTAGGSKNALTLSPSPAITAYATGQRFIFTAGGTASDDAVTIAVSGLASPKAAEFNDAACSATVVIEAGKHYEALYDGTAFQLTRLSELPFDSSTLGTMAVEDTSAVPAMTYAGTQNYADQILQRPEIKDYAETEASVSSSSGTLTLDCESGNNFHTTLTENVTTLTLSNWPATGKRASITLEITQHASSAKTVAWGAAVDFGDAGAPDLTTVGSVTIVVLTTRDAGTTVYGMTAFQKTS